MFRLEKEFRFEAAHRLPNHEGKCRRLHGHSYRVMITLEKGQLFCDGPRTGMVVDFDDVTVVVEPILRDYLDHHYLNDTLGFEDTTSENIACWIYNQVKPFLPDVVSVRVSETCTSAVEYRE